MAVSPDRMVEIFDRVKDCLEYANENGTLHELLYSLGLQGLIYEDEEIDLGEADNAYGDILVLGRCDAKKNHLQAVAHECGYDKNRVKFVDYDEMQQFDCSSLCYSMRYSAIMCGPVPHKAGDMGDTSSILEELRHPERGYPPPRRAAGIRRHRGIANNKDNIQVGNRAVGVHGRNQAQQVKGT